MKLTPLAWTLLVGTLVAAYSVALAANFVRWVVDSCPRWA